MLLRCTSRGDRGGFCNIKFHKKGHKNFWTMSSSGNDKLLQTTELNVVDGSNGPRNTDPIVET